MLNKRTKLKDENESRVYYRLQYVNLGREVREFVRNIFYGLFNLLVFDKIIVSNRKSFSFIFLYYNLQCRYFLLLSLFRSIGVAINFSFRLKSKNWTRIRWNEPYNLNKFDEEIQRWQVTITSKQANNCLQRFTIQRRSK